MEGNQLFFHQHLQDGSKFSQRDVFLSRDLFQGFTHHILMVLADEGREDEALEHLEVALRVWSAADPEFKWARRARELKLRLETDSAQ